MPLKDYDSVEVAIEKFLDSLEMDDANQARAQIALALARTLDQAKDSTSGAMSQSVPGTAKELRECMKAIQDNVREGDAFLEGLLKN